MQTENRSHRSITRPALPSFKGVQRARQLISDRPAPTSAWDLDYLGGRFVELSGGANSSTLTQAARLVWQAQCRGDHVAWIADQQSIFFPPDLAQHGIDLAALPVIAAQSPKQAAHIADQLLRCAGFTLLVMDLSHRSDLPLAAQTRLAALAKHHHTVLLCLTRKRRNQEASLGSLISLRAVTETHRTDRNEFTSQLSVVKDKRQGPGQMRREVYCGPDGLC